MKLFLTTALSITYLAANTYTLFTPPATAAMPVTNKLHGILLRNDCRE